MHFTVTMFDRQRNAQSLRGLEKRQNATFQRFLVSDQRSAQRTSTLVEGIVVAESEGIPTNLDGAQDRKANLSHMSLPAKRNPYPHWVLRCFRSVNEPITPAERWSRIQGSFIL